MLSRVAPVTESTAVALGRGNGASAVTSKVVFAPLVVGPMTEMEEDLSGEAVVVLARVRDCGVNTSTPLY